MQPAFFQITLKLFLLDQKGRLLILRDRASGLGDLPGGRLGKGEIRLPWKEVMEREVHEELGSGISWSMVPEPVFCFGHYIQSDQCEGLGLAFTGRFHSGEIILSDEHDFSEWAEPESYPFENLFQDTMLDAVKTFIEGHYKTNGR